MEQAHRLLIPPQRLPRWVDGFALRHGPPSIDVRPTQLTLTAANGAEAVLELIWGPLPGLDPLAELFEQVARPRRLAALLVRKSAHAVGVFEGNDLVAHRLGRHYVQGRTKAGGWSQQRYARRREHQAERAYAKAADAAQEVLLPQLGALDGLVLGGDARALREVLDVAALAPLAALAERLHRPTLAVPDPNLQVLRDVLPRFVAVPISVNDMARTNSTLAQHDDQAGQER
ncbi:MAG: hypothetical protein IPL41_16620 [Micropruina sp.]|nr:hypothetical protein [Micropruina sp.]